MPVYNKMPTRCNNDATVQRRRGQARQVAATNEQLLETQVPTTVDATDYLPPSKRGPARKGKNKHESDVKLSPNSVDRMPLLDRILSKPLPLSAKVWGKAGAVLLRLAVLIAGFNMWMWAHWTYGCYYTTAVATTTEQHFMQTACPTPGKELL